MKTCFTQYRLAVLSGLLLGATFPTWHLYPLAWVALAPLFYCTLCAAPSKAFRQFFVAGAAFYLMILQWLMANVYWAGGWAFCGYVALALFMALYWGLAGAAWAFVRRLSCAPASFSMAILWAAMEQLQATLFTGFGWGALGYAQGPDLPLLQWASLGSVILIGALLVAVNVLLAQVVAERNGRVVRGLALAAIVVGSHGLGYFLLASPVYDETPFAAGVVQTNFSLEMKWDWEYTEEMVRNAAEKSRWLAQNQHVDLLIWPESLIMDSIDRPGIQNLVTGLTIETGCPLFAGAIRVDSETGADLNSSYLVDAQGQIAAYYDKIHLAPFGEYVPLGTYFPFIRKVVPAIGEIGAGGEPKVLHTGDRSFGPLICFEVLFPPLAEALRERGADFLVVITNLGWFGESNAIAEELEIARLRAVETRLPLVHSANTGISGVFDPWGRFRGIDCLFDAQGHVRRLASPDPAQTIRERLFGAVPVPRPGPRLIPYGPRVFPWCALAAALLLTVSSVVVRRRGLGASQ